MIHLTLLGPTDLRADDGRPVDALLAQPRAVALLAYLAVAGPRPDAYHRRDRLAGFFWPEHAQAQARANLRRLVHDVRALLGEGVIENRGDEELRVSPTGFRSDVALFLEALERERLARALELYGGELLPGFHASAAPEFDQWLEARRWELAELAAEAAWKLATSFKEGEPTNAGHWAVRAARLSFHNERRFRRALQLLVEIEMIRVVFQLFDEFERRLAEVGAPPSTALRVFIDGLRRR